jgi:flavin reductase (DIM6/NTAB) family NADH-FMN oxidoreductase RutF
VTTTAVRERFRAAMRRMASSVLVLTAQTEHGPRGMTITAFISLSMDPPRVAFAVNEKAGLHAHVRPGRQLCINVLSDGDEAVARAFSGVVEAARRFQVGRWGATEDCAPRLETAAASVFVEVVEVARHGSHSLVVAEVRDAMLGQDGAPLLYCAGRYVNEPKDAVFAAV